MWPGLSARSKALPSNLALAVDILSQPCNDSLITRTTKGKTMLDLLFTLAVLALALGSLVTFVHEAHVKADHKLAMLRVARINDLHDN